MSTSARTRLLNVVALVLCGSVLAMAYAGLGRPPEIESPKIQFADLPLRLGDWEGEAIAISDAELDALDAADEASFRFTAAEGSVAFVHAATWDDPQFVGESCPHHPLVCYRNTGWEIIEEQTRNFRLRIEGTEPPDRREATERTLQTEVPIKLLRVRRADERAVVGFVYQLGDQFFVDELGARKIQFGLLMQSQWPYVSKYLMQTPADSIDSCHHEIEALLGSLIRWHIRQRSAQRPETL